MRKILIVITLLLLIHSCKTKLYSYESDSQKGKSYISYYKEYSLDIKDSSIITGKVFLKGKKEIKVVNSADLIFINEKNDTISVHHSYLNGYEIKIPKGKYHIFLNVNSSFCINLELNEFEIKPNKIYFIEYYMQKGNGVSKWSF